MHRHDSMETFEANAAATGILPHPHKRVKPQNQASPAPQGDVAMVEKANPASRTSKTTLSQMTGSRYCELEEKVAA